MTTSLKEPAVRTTQRASVGGDELTFKLTSQETGGEVLVFEVAIGPGGGPPVLHRHDPFELYRVCSGELTIYSGGEDGVVRPTLVRAGESFPIAGGVEHTVRNESDEEATALVVFSPGEPMERFIRAAGDLGPDASPADIAALAEEHGIAMTRSIADALAAG